MDAENTLYGVNWFAGYVNGEQVYASMIPGTHTFDYSGDYTVTIYLKAKDGYKFKFNEDGQYHEVETCVDGLSALHSTIEEMDGEEYMAVVMYFYTESPAYSITVEGGNAYDRGKTEIITSATEGAYVWAIADEAPEGQMFYYWEVVSGIDKIDESALKNPEFSFIVGSEDIVIRAVYGEAYVLGDANGDGEVKTADSLMAKRIAAGIDTPTELQEIALDVNGDGKINSADTNLISRFIAGIIIEF